MILDTSAVLTVLFKEPGFEVFLEIISQSPDCRISAANFLELAMVASRQLGAASREQCDAFLRDAEILVEPISVAHALIARQAFFRFGKGRHPAGFNFGDCFSYALAKATGEPLLFKGDDFSKTDLISAVRKV